METFAVRLRVPAVSAVLAVLAIAAPAAPAAGAAGRGADAAPPNVSFAPARTYRVHGGAGQETFAAPGAVAVGDLNGDGRPDLVLANDRSDDVSVLLGSGGGSFDAARNFHAGLEPVWVAVGDLDGDHRPDVAVADREGGVSVLLGRGDGTLRPERSHALARPYGGGDVLPDSVAIGDLNGDGKPDLTVGSDNGIAVLLGRGHGRFRPARYELALGVVSGAVAVGDPNGDGKPDLLFAGDGVGVLLGKGDGSFGSVRRARGGRVSELLAWATIADLNGDRRPDFVVGDNGERPGVLVLVGRGDGSFLPARRVVSGSPLVALGDLNGNGKPDLAVAAESASRISVLLGNGDATFGEARSLTVGNTLPIGEHPTAVALGDLNGDGKPDLVVATTGQLSGHVSVLLNTTGHPAAPPAKTSKPGAPSALSFAAKGSYRVGGSAALADLNGDRKPDLVAAAASGRVSVLLGRGNGRFRAPRHYRASSESAIGRALGTAPAVALADLNGDGKPDLVVAAHHVSALLGTGNGGFRAAAGYPHQTAVGDKGDNWQAVAVGDLNHDGKTDLVVSTFGDGADEGDLLLLLGNGKGGFRAGDHITHTGRFLGASSATVGDVAVGDLDGDRRPDLVTATLGTLTVLRGRTNGKLQTVSRYRLSRSPSPLPSFAIGDLNGDRKPDLVAVDSGTLTVLLGKGNGHFLSRHYRADGDTVTVADLNGDGKPDLALGVSGGVSLLLGVGEGRFRQGGTFRVAAGEPTSISVADLNGDGRPDLAVGTTGEAAGHVSVLLNTTRFVKRR